MDNQILIFNIVNGYMLVFFFFWGLTAGLLFAGGTKFGAKWQLPLFSLLVAVFWPIVLLIAIFVPVELLKQ